MPPADHPDTSAVRRAPRPAPPDGSGGPPGTDATGSWTSRLLVIGFAVLFALGSLAFLARVLTAVEEDSSSPAPSASLAVSSASPSARAALPSLTPSPSASPSAAPVASSVAALLPVDAATEADDVVVPAQALEPTIEPTPPAQTQPSPPPGTSPAASRAPCASPASTPEVPPPTAEASVAPATAEPSPSGAPTSVDPCGTPEPAATTAPAALTTRDMPFVPVVRFWQTRTSIPKDALVQALRGRSRTWDRVLIPDGDRAALEAALGITIPASVREASPGAIVAAVKKGRTLGVLRATDVVPSVRALGIDGRQLFGNDRVRGLSRWPVVASVAVEPDRAWRQADTWTLVAGGDSFTDRGIYERVEARGKGVDYPFDGGRARVRGHHICPSCPRAEGNLVPIYRLSGPKGIVRALVKDADLAIANHEQPTPTNWTYHLQGLRFSGKPDLTRVFTRAGIDFMSLANNHIRDYGDAGVINTLKTLDKYGIRHAGAGPNVKAAARPAYLEVKGVTVGIVACNQFSVARVRATKTRAGALTCKSDEAFDAIRAARKKADVLIVFPHWGIEYTRNRVAYQERLAARWERMGVDLVIGAHSHVPGGIGDIDGMPVFYSLGNFIFDQTWSTATMEGILAEMTFAGDRLVQIRIHPFLTHDQAQPNLLDPARDDGRALMEAIRKASKRISDW